MRRQFLGFILLFTGISSLASAQWESDRFLFEPQSNLSRPKTVKQNTLSEKKSAHEVESNLSPPAASLVPKVEVPGTQERSPAGIDLPKVKLGPHFGFIDLNSKSNWNELQFKQSSYTFGVKLSTAIGDISDLTFCYSSTPGLGPFRREEVFFENTYKVTLFDRELQLGPALRQTALWGSEAMSNLKFQQISNVGLSGHLNLAPQGKWRPLLSVQIYPVLINNNSSVRGSLSNFEWTTYFETKSTRAFMLNLGYERLDLTNTSATGGTLIQGQLKMFVGYRLSTY